MDVREGPKPRAATSSGLRKLDSLLWGYAKNNVYETLKSTTENQI